MGNLWPTTLRSVILSAFYYYLKLANNSLHLKTIEISNYICKALPRHYFIYFHLSDAFSLFVTYRKKKCY